MKLAEKNSSEGGRAQSQCVYSCGQYLLDVVRVSGRKSQKRSPTYFSGMCKLNVEKKRKFVRESVGQKVVRRILMLSLMVDGSVVRVLWPGDQKRLRGLC